MGARHTGVPFQIFLRNNVAWLTIDSYNDTLIGSADQVSRFGATNPNFSTIGGMEAEAQSAADAHDDVTRLRLDELWAKLKDSRYSPLGVFKAPQEKLTSEGWGNLGDDRYYLAIRRACKFGIQQVLQAVSPDAKIHFILDLFATNQGERMRGAAFKGKVDARGRIAVPITYSEIRHIYRHWSELRDKVLFYYNFVEDIAPWQDDVRTASWRNAHGHDLSMTFRELWDVYAEERKDKYKKMYLKAVNSGQYNRRLVDNLKTIHQYVQAAEVAGQAHDAWAEQDNYEKALELLEPDKNNWKSLQT